MERADVELVAQLGRRLTAQLLDLQLADLVRERLAGPGDVAIHLELDFRRRERAVFLQAGHRTLARPAHYVHAGIDDQPARAPDLERKAAELFVRVAETGSLSRAAQAMELSNAAASRQWFIESYNKETSEMIRPRVVWNLPNGSRREINAERVLNAL